MSQDIFAVLKQKKIKSESKVFLKKTEAENYFRQLQFQPKTIVLLQGKMGSGKSQTVKWLCGVADSSSPSYALHHSYKNKNQSFEHFDLDRLEAQDDLESAGFWDIFSQTQSIVLIEWPERLNLKELPFDWSIVTIQIESPGDAESEERSVTVTNYAALA